MRPALDTLPVYYANYVKLVNETDVNTALEVSAMPVVKMLGSIKPAQYEYRYALGKWSVRQVISHMIDTERIMSYRALRFARGDAQQMPAFEEDDFAKALQAGDARPELLLKEFESVRAASRSLFGNFSENTLQRKGKALQGEMSVLAMGFLICGHALHHCNVLRDRYELR